MGGTVVARGRLVLEGRVEPGRVLAAGDLISAVELDPAEADGPFVAPGFVDVHVHGWGGHDAMGGREALDGMARALLGRGVTSFLPTAVTADIATLAAFTATVRDWMQDPPLDGAAPLGSNLEGPFIAPGRKGAQNPAFIRRPIDVPFADLEPLVEGLRIVTVAPELPGAQELIAWLAERGVVASLGHSDASVAEARAGYAAGARTTTHLFNAMRGVDHREPGLAVAALLEDDACVELVADGYHVHPSLWPLILRAKPVDRLVLVSDAISLAGTGDGRGRLGGLEVEVRGGRCTLVDGGNLAGSVIAIDDAVRNLVAADIPLPRAVAAATRDPLALIGVTDRGRIATGQRADLVELDASLVVRAVVRAGVRVGGAGAGLDRSPAAEARGA